jgi:hypothetical protein
MFYGSTRSEVLSKVRKHMWKAHETWMKRRIKTGLKKHKQQQRILVDSAGNSLWNPSWIGFAERPIIEKVTGMKYEDVKSKVLDFFVQMLLGGVTKPT